MRAHVCIKCQRVCVCGAGHGARHSHCARGKSHVRAQNWARAHACARDRLAVYLRLRCAGACEEDAVRAGVIDALVNAQADLLTLPQRNVALPMPPPGTETGEPARWPARGKIEGGVPRPSMHAAAGFARQMAAGTACGLAVLLQCESGHAQHVCPGGCGLQEVGG